MRYIHLYTHNVDVLQTFAQKASGTLDISVYRSDNFCLLLDNFCFYIGRFLERLPLSLSLLAVDNILYRIT